MDFRFNSVSSSNKISFTATQLKVGSITRTLTVSWLSGKWTLAKKDNTTTTTSYVNQTLTAGTDYVTELRFEGLKANLYVYQKGQSRPTTPTGSLDAYAVATKLSASLVNATASGQIQRNLSTPSVSSVQSAPISSRFDFVTNSSLIKPPQGASVNSTDFSSITYDPSSNLKQVLLKDGTKLLFENGLLKESYDKDGSLTSSFDFTESGLSNILGSKITQNNLASEYDAEGKLSSVKLGDLTIHYKSDETTIDFIEKTDGTELYDLFFDDDGNITGATIYTPEGEIRTYENGKLVNLRKPDTTELFYFDDKPLKLITPEQFTYNFDYTIPDIVVADLDPSIVLTDTLTAVKMQYDTSFNLKKVVRQNQEIINYTGKDILSIESPDEARKVFDYQRDGDGKILSYTVTQDNVVTSYDANNQPLEATIFPDADNPATLRVTYQYGKIREIYKKKDSASLEVLTFQYTYTFTTDNEEITNIEDLEEKTSKVYKAGNLLTSLDNETSVLSTYEYVIASVAAGVAKQSDLVSKVVVTRLGRTLHTYTYTYSTQQLNNSPTQLTIVTDEEGTIRTYSADKKLAFLEKDNQKFSYSYADNEFGDEIVEEKLTEKKLSAGSVAHYDNGKVTKIDLSDGTFVTDILLDDNRLIQQATLNLTDGARLTFTNNELTEVIDANGRQLEYSYDRNTDGSGDANLKYDAEGNLLGLKLDGVLTPEEVRQATQDTYVGGVGENSVDGDYNTSQGVSTQRNFDRNQGSVSVSVYSTHSFPEPQTITRIEYSAWEAAAGTEIMAGMAMDLFPLSIS